MATDKLTDTAIRRVKSEDKPFKMADGRGLFLEVRPEGGRLWRFRYRFGGKEKLLSMGQYPDTSLSMARDRREEARRLLAQGIDPSAQRKEQKAEAVRREQIAVVLASGGAVPGTFKAVAEAWLEERHKPATSPGHWGRTVSQLERDVFPWLGSLPLREVTAPVVLEVIRRVAARGALDTASRVRSTIGAVLRFGIGLGECSSDVTRDLRDVLPPAIKGHRAAILEPGRLGELLRAIDGFQGQPGTRVALLMAVLTAQRPGNVRSMKWEDVDLDKRVWIIPSSQMKRTLQDKSTGLDHKVPLAHQAVDLLRGLHKLTGTSVYCFPGLRGRDRPISDVTLNAAMRRLGFAQDEVSSHGFRATLRTLGVELLGVDAEVLEAHLGHGKPGPLGAAYDRTTHLAARCDMAQRWADLLDVLKGKTSG